MVRSKGLPYGQLRMSRMGYRLCVLVSKWCFSVFTCGFTRLFLGRHGRLSLVDLNMVEYGLS